MRILFLIFAVFLVSCDQPEDKAEEPPPPEEPSLVLEAVDYEAWPGWESDDFSTFSQAFHRSCERILKADPKRLFADFPEAGTYADWQKICLDFQVLVESLSYAESDPGPADIPFYLPQLIVEKPDEDLEEVPVREHSAALRAFFEEYFQPYALMADEKPEGLFTGYYEAALNGALARDETYRYPLHMRPNDLVMVNLGEFREDLKGRRIAGRVINGQLKPYEDRAEIVSGNWPHNDDVLVWVDDPVDAFFVQIQGSGLVRLEGGSMMRIGYAGQNGHPYYAIGRELIKRGHLEKDTVSMQSIRAWLATNPDQADEIMNSNKSYVFFRRLDGAGPVGGEGVALTPGRSLAVDRSLLPYGLPLWVDIDPPVEGAPPLQHLMIAQDTGGAIRGPVRGDVFWGSGPQAEEVAGRMKSTGRYWALLPKRD